jgi:hypothetical protein
MKEVSVFPSIHVSSPEEKKCLFSRGKQVYKNRIDYHYQ